MALFGNRANDELKVIPIVITLVVSMLLIGPFSSSMAVAYASRTSGELTEWVVPTPRSGVQSLTLGPSGDCCYFLEYLANKVGHLDPSTGTFQEWVLPTAGANPFSIATTTHSGSLEVWGTEFGADRIFMLSPQTGIFREYNLTHFNSGVTYISVEPSAQVRVWFTESFSNLNGEAIYDPQTDNVTLYEDPFPVGVGGGAYGVYAESNSVWFAGFSALVRWDRVSQEYTLWPLPVHGSSVGRVITVDRYGEPWYTQGVTDANSTDNYVGVLRENNTFQEWHILSPGSDPMDIAMNPSTQQPWIADESQQAGNGTISSLDAFGGGGTLLPVTQTTVRSGGYLIVLAPTVNQANVTSRVVTPTIKPISGSQRGAFTEYALGSTLPRNAIIDSSDNIWISEPGANKIARLSLTGSDFALTSSPPIYSLPQGGSGMVTITGISVSGYAGRVILTRETIPTGLIASRPQPSSIDIPSSGNASSQITISVGPNASVGSSSILIGATDGTITHTLSIIVFVTKSTVPAVSTGPKCLIATATYGSETSPEVQVLRDFRDKDVQKTRIGSSFLLVFNTWYYSFSPYVATYIASHGTARVVMKFLLYPLIAFLYLAYECYSALSSYPEVAITLSGLLASSLIGAFYIGLPLGLFGRRFRFIRQLGAKALAMLLVGGITTVVVAQALSDTILLMISSSATVLLCMALSATLTARTISRNQRAP